MTRPQVEVLSVQPLVVRIQGLARPEAAFLARTAGQLVDRFVSDGTAARPAGCRCLFGRHLEPPPLTRGSA